MTPIQRMIAEARSFIGTPFRHAGREKGIGVDCVGILTCAAREAGIFVYDNVNYSPLVKPEFLVGEILKYCNFVPPGDRKPGDILLFNIHGQAQHTGLMVTPKTFVHAFQTVNAVCESDLEPVFSRGLVAVFRVKERLWQPSS